jgi:hypothetical protein
MIDRDRPHHVALPASQSTSGGYKAIHIFCKDLSLCPRGHADEWFNVYCFVSGPID